jgi:FixJ family two-component response regulator
VKATVSTVCLVDDDPGVRTGLTRVLREEGWNVRAFDSAEAFMAQADPFQAACLILDVALPGLDGLELQRRLAESGRVLPIVFLTGHGDIPMSVRAIKAGAIDFLTKPVHSEELIAAIRTAIDQVAQQRQAEAETADLRQRFASLTPREREVLAGLAAGRLNKQIAADLGVVEQTVKFHRSRIMERMQARTIAELMHVAARVGIGTPPATRVDAPAGATRRPPR